MTALPILHAIGTAARRAWRRLHIRMLRARERQLELQALSLCLDPYPGCQLELAYLMAQAAALRGQVKVLEMQR